MKMKKLFTYIVPAICEEKKWQSIKTVLSSVTILSTARCSGLWNLFHRGREYRISLYIFPGIRYNNPQRRRFYVPKEI